MSMQTGLATSTTQLRSYAPATDVSVAAPAPQLDIARAGPVAAGRNPRTEPGPIRFIIIALAILLVVGPDVIFGLSAAILFGAIIGTFSTIYVSAPMLIWLGVGPDSFVPTDASGDAERVAARLP